MALINNSKLTKEIIDGAKINTVVDAVPSQIAEKVVPVMEVNPKMLRVCNIVRSTLLIAPTTLYTTPANKDFYICSAYVQVSGEDSNPARIITVTIEGQAQVLLQIAGKSLAAGAISDNDLSINPAYPIKIDRESNIVISGVGTGAAGIIGFLVDE